MRHPTQHHPRTHGQRGQALPLVLLLLALAALGALLVSRTALVAADRARAQQAADAAALAGAAAGRPAADRIAARNGATIEHYEQRGDQVVVRARVGEAAATASARRSWERCGARDPCGGGSVP
jgi:hypothetical protein